MSKAINTIAANGLRRLISCEEFERISSESVFEFWVVARKIFVVFSFGGCKRSNFASNVRFSFNSFKSASNPFIVW